MDVLKDNLFSSEEYENLQYISGILIIIYFSIYSVILILVYIKLRLRMDYGAIFITLGYLMSFLLRLPIFE